MEPFDPGNSYTQFPAMDRAVAQRPDYGFGVAAFSSRTQNYESINNENVRGWHTADGRTTVYTSDLDQYGSGYWATIDSTRIPGTTVEEHVVDDVVAPQLGRLVLQGPTTVTEDFADLDGVFYRSPRWQVDTADAAAFGGDATRVRRTEDSQETLVMRLDSGITGFSLDVHHTALSDLSRLLVMSSPNNSSYAPVRLTFTTTGQTGEWSHVTVTPAEPLPAGTTYLRLHLMPSVPQARGTQDWVGGVELDGAFGATGMELATPSQSLTARKSWFVLDDEVVAVGSDITATDGRDVETVVENRRLTDRFPGLLTVDGQDLGAATASRTSTTSDGPLCTAASPDPTWATSSPTEQTSPRPTRAGPAPGRGSATTRARRAAGMPVSTWTTASTPRPPGTPTSCCPDAARTRRRSTPRSRTSRCWHATHRSTPSGTRGWVSSPRTCGVTSPPPCRWTVRTS